MASYSAMGQRMAQIKGELFKSPLWQGRPSLEAEAEREASRLERIGSELELITRDLTSGEHLALARLASLRRNVERAHRWDVSQSLHQRLNDARALKEEANQLAEMIGHLLDNNRPNLLQAADTFKDLAEALEKAFGHQHHGHAVTLHTAQGDAFYGQVPQANFFAASDASVSSLVPVMIFAISGLRWLAARLRQKDSH